MRPFILFTRYSIENMSKPRKKESLSLGTSMIMQNLVFLIEPPTDDFDKSSKMGNMFLNRFCIDEDAPFELFGVHELKKKSKRFGEDTMTEKISKIILGRTAKGKGNYHETFGVNKLLSQSDIPVVLLNKL